MDFNNEKKNCSYCGEEIPANAGRCPFCGSLLDMYVDPEAIKVKARRQDGDMGSGNDSVGKRPLGNGWKVFLIMLFTLPTGLGQLAGIITAIIFMNADDDADRKSFGIAILVASLVMFVIACIAWFILIIAFLINQSFIYR